MSDYLAKVAAIAARAIQKANQLEDLVAEKLRLTSYDYSPAMDGIWTLDFDVIENPNQSYQVVLYTNSATVSVKKTSLVHVTVE